METKIILTNEQKEWVRKYIEKCKTNTDEACGDNKGYHSDDKYSYVARWWNGSYFIIENKATMERIFEMSLDFDYVWNFNYRRFMNWIGFVKEKNETNTKNNTI